ncbi:MAG: hypothetical protein ABFD62_17365 [Syntrophaceae bacterium]
MKRTFLISVFALAFVLCSCSRPAEEPDPQAALAGYFDAVISGNYEEAAKYLPAQARQQAAAKSQESESFEEKMVRRALASYVSYEIVIIEKTEGKARATAKIKSPDFHRIAMDAAARLIAAKFPRGGIESLEYAAEIINAQIRSLKAQGIPMVSTIRNYELVKEGGAWKISGSD